MQRAKALPLFDQGLKDAISEVRRDEYRRELAAAPSSVSLNVIENRVRADYQLTLDDRLQLVGEIECAMASVP
jgi:hypothetical protein